MDTLEGMGTTVGQGLLMLAAALVLGKTFKYVVYYLVTYLTSRTTDRRDDRIAQLIAEDWHIPVEDREKMEMSEGRPDKGEVDNDAEAEK